MEVLPIKWTPFTHALAIGKGFDGHIGEYKVADIHLLGGVWKARVWVFNHMFGFDGPTPDALKERVQTELAEKLWEIML